MNPMQEYPHIIELFACIPNIFVYVFMSNEFPIFLGACSTPKQSK